MAIVRPFPAHRRVAMIRRLADQILAMTQSSGEKLLKARLSRHATTLANKGIDPQEMREDCGRFEAAVRAELWRQVMRPHGGGSA